MGNETAAFEEWAVIELMGHARAAGRIREQQIAGAGFLRLDVPGADGEIAYTRFYAPGAVYSITPVSQEVAVALAQRLNTPPVTRWEIPQLEGSAQPMGCVTHPVGMDGDQDVTTTCAKAGTDEWDDQE